MGGIRKDSRAPRRPNLRSRLQRALSLSGDESPSHEQSDPGDQENRTSADESKQEAAPQRSIELGGEMDLEIRGQIRLSEDCNTVALECLTELDNRMRSIERSSHDQFSWNETIRNDLADIFGRLAIVESEVQKMIRQSTNKATEGQKIGRSLRRQQ